MQGNNFKIKGRGISIVNKKMTRLSGSIVENCCQSKMFEISSQKEARLTNPTWALSHTSSD